MVSVGVNQVGRMNLGRQVESLQYFNVCGQQEGYKPFAFNMTRDPSLWMSWKLPQFTSVLPDDHSLQVSAIFFYYAFPRTKHHRVIVGLLIHGRLWDLALYVPVVLLMF